MTEFAREAITVFRIRQKFCSLTYGTSPCTASVGVTGPDRCFNTTKTCQDRDNLNLTTRDLYLVSMRGNINRPLTKTGVPVYAISSLASVDMSSAVVNIGSGDKDVKALGARGTATVTIMDHPHSDNWVDPYRDQRSYIATERGTFWSKWLARNPYYQNTLVDIFNGYVGDDIDDMDQRTYIIREIVGPTGQVQIRCLDILAFADDERAQCPAVSGGTLMSAITDSDVTLDITTSTDEYTATGTVAIGSENITYSGKSVITGGYRLTGLTRGVDGTTAASHDAEEKVQLCYRVTDANVWDVLQDLYENYASIPSAYIPYADWVVEGEEWLIPYRITAVIREPTGVNQLAGELCRDTACMNFWNERTQTIPLVAVKPSWPVELAVTDTNNSLAGSVRISTKAEQRINEVWVFYGARDNSKKLDAEGNARFIQVTLDATAQAPEEYDDRRIRKIYSRWISTGTHAFEIATSILRRYRDAPITVSFRVPRRDQNLWLADIVNMTHRRFVDEYGVVQPKRFQVTSAKELPGTDQTEYSAETFPFFGRFAGWMEDAAADYADADEFDRENGGYWSDEDGLMPDGTQGYQWQ